MTISEVEALPEYQFLVQYGFSSHSRGLDGDSNVVSVYLVHEKISMVHGLAIGIEFDPVKKQIEFSHVWKFFILKSGWCGLPNKNFELFFSRMVAAAIALSKIEN